MFYITASVDEIVSFLRNGILRFEVFTFTYLFKILLNYNYMIHLTPIKLVYVTYNIKYSKSNFLANIREKQTGKAATINIEK